MRSGYICSVRVRARGPKKKINKNKTAKEKLLHTKGRGDSVVVWLRSRWCNFELTVAGDRTLVMLE